MLRHAANGMFIAALIFLVLYGFDTPTLFCFVVGCVLVILASFKREQ